MSLPVVITIGVSTLCLYKFLRGLWDVNFTPGPRTMLSPLSTLAAILPASSFNPSNTWFWNSRRTAYFNQTHDVIAFVPWLIGSPTYYTNSLDVMKQLLNLESKLHLEKPKDLTLARLWGHNVTSANGDMWRRHRRVVSPAFNLKTFSDVWRTVKVVYQEMVEAEGWDRMNEVTFDEVNSWALKFTFMIICRCGFGFTTSWEEGEESSTNFAKALRSVSETLIPRMVLPNWIYKLPFKKLQKMDEAWFTVATSISDLIEERKSGASDIETDDGRPVDILNRLVTSWVNIDKHGLTERDVISNMFSLMFAGHETTSSGIVTTLGYLALYPSEQENAYKEISRVFSECDSSELIDPNKLSFTLHCFWEAQRLCPAAAFIPRQLTEDAIVTIERPKRQQIVVKKGSFFMFDLVGIYRNPHTFKDPEVFKPDRWDNVSEHDVGTFGFGPRSCVGRKFAQTEALALLSILLSEWKIEPNMMSGESKESYVERVMSNAGLVGTAFGLKHVPLKLTKRQVQR